jgi:hypothetical protein
VKFPIETSGMTVLVAEPPAQRRDFDTKAPKTTEDGRPVFQLRVLMMDGAESAPMRVTVHGDPQVSAMQPVRLLGLSINITARNGESIMWVTAERVEAAGPPLASLTDGSPPPEGAAGTDSAAGSGGAAGAGSGRGARKADG